MGVTKAIAVNVGKEEEKGENVNENYIHKRKMSWGYEEEEELKKTKDDKKREQRKKEMTSEDCIHGYQSIMQNGTTKSTFSILVKMVERGVLQRRAWN